MRQSSEVEVSIVVLTYNSKFEKVKETLDSIISQIHICFEIVIADDGSQNNHFDEINNYFDSHSFANYILIENKINKGTVANYYSGLLKATGKYIKGISPGDRLYKADTLRNWVDYLEKNNLRWAFSEAVYYTLENGNIRPISVNAHPNNIKIYENGTSNDKRWQYVVLKDVAVGSSLLSTRELQVNYCKEILNKVIYAEDNIWRMMMFDGIVGGYYPEYTILYEYGTGISTSRNDIWLKRIRKDWINTDKIIINRNNVDAFQQKMKKAILISNGDSRLKKIFIKNMLKKKIMSLTKRKTINYLP